jgi:hypothetical protein
MSNFKRNDFIDKVSSMIININLPQFAQEAIEFSSYCLILMFLLAVGALE